MPRYRSNNSKYIQRHNQRNDHKKDKSKDGLEQRLEHFSEEIGSIGEKIEKRFDKKERRFDGWFQRTFGVAGPFVSSLVGVAVLGLVILAINAVNTSIGSGFLTNMNSFLMDNLLLLFLIMLFFSYTSYFSRMHSRNYLPVSPVLVGVGVTIGFWLVAKILFIANMSLNMQVLSRTVMLIDGKLFWIFFGFTLLGYLVLVVKTVIENMHESNIRARETIARPKPVRRVYTSKTNSAGNDVRRLYRSGREKILGGVCGGIAEYLGVDPVLIRLLWVIGSLAWGFGIIAYIVAWIIIPREPDYRW